MRIAIVHDWLSAFGGAERVLAQLLRMFPGADLFALFDHFNDEQHAALGHGPARTSFLAGAPWLRRRYRLYLPLMPLAAETLDLSGYELVISSSFAVAKGVLTSPDQRHVSFVHSPMRYAWDQRRVYLSQAGLRGARGALAETMLSGLRGWDARSSHGPEAIACPSAYVARRITKCWGRSASVIPPPVDLSRFSADAPRETEYLLVSRLVPYKRADLVARAFALLPNARLTIIGDGPERARVAAAAGSNVRLAGALPDAEVARAMARAKAFVFAGEEDFGITLVEAQASGCPVVAFGRGGAAEIVRHGETGILFEEQSVEAVAAAIVACDAAAISPRVCAANAARFSPEIFAQRFGNFVAPFMLDTATARIAAE